MKIFKRVLITALATLAVLILVFFVYYATVTKNVRLSEEKLTVNSVNVCILDDRNVPVDNCGNAQSDVPYDKFPQDLVHAFVATEDRRFFSHDGFDVRRIAKALLKNVFSLSIKEGASTISQQLIKNTHLTGEKTIKRKLQEVKLTRQLERRYTKEEIMEKYLNTIYFGHSAFGIKEAAKYYFNCDVENLTTGNCAMLAGLVKSPNNYSPFKQPERCLSRRNNVLSYMKNEGYLDENAYQSALAEPLPATPTKSHEENAYCQYVQEELDEIFEKNGREISGNIVVRTYLNKEAQKELTKQLSYTATNKVGGVLDNLTGGFIAFVSDVGNLSRTPASTIKPLAVYAPAIQERLLSPISPILDKAVNYGGYSPKNYDGKFRGYVSARESLSKSLNVPAVKILNALTVEKSKEYLDKLHLNISPEDEHLALALGGMTHGFTMPQLLSAYSVFPCDGAFVEGAFIKSIEQNGNILYRHNLHSEKVFDESTAYLVSDMLIDCAKTGTAKKLKTLPFTIAAKTGTAGARDKNTDAYAIAYTKGYTSGVWIGNANNEKITQTGGGFPCETICNLFEYLYKKMPADAFGSFHRPDDVVALDLDKTSYEESHALLLADENSPLTLRLCDLFRKDNAPKEKCTIFSNPRVPAPTILYKNDCVEIIFDENTPDFFTIKIEKETDGEKEIVYFDTLKNTFIDTDLSQNKTYIYTITPYFEDREGESITLPAVTTKSLNPGNVLPPGIANKPWWEY